MVNTPQLDIHSQPISQQNETNATSQGLKLEDVNKLIEEKLAAAKTETLKDTRIEMDRQLQSANASFITVFGIFASITSFLTIEFQFLKALSNTNQIIGFTLILWALLFSFNLGLDYLVTNRLNQEKYKPNWYLMLISVVLLMSGIAFSIWGNMDL